MTEHNRLPKSQANTRYPYNKVMVTESGHEIHYDDTPGAERIRIAHKSGTYVEVGPDGREVRFTVGNKFEVNKGGVTLTINENQDVKISGHQRLCVGGGSHIEVAGDANMVVGGDSISVIGGNMKAAVAGDVYTGIQGNQNINVNGNMNLKVKGNITMEADGDITQVAAGTHTSRGADIQHN